MRVGVGAGGADAASLVRKAPQPKGLITPAPTSGPVRIDRYWPSPPISALVRHYWIPRWNLPPGARLRQEVLEYPTANLVIEPTVARLYRAQRGRFSRTLEDVGWAFGVLLQPGTARGLLGVSVRTLPMSADLSALALTAVEPLLADVRGRVQAGDDAGAIDVFEGWLAGQMTEPDDDALLIDEIVSAVEADRDLLRVEELADRFGLGVRHLQRLVGSHIGFSPKWLIQRYRLQEAAAALRNDNPPALAELAATLGYADQAHFSREFRSVVGATPHAYGSLARAEREGTA